MYWYISVLRNYAKFSGRARRKEYWMFFLFNMLFLILAIIADYLLYGFPLLIYPNVLYYFYHGDYMYLQSTLDYLLLPDYPLPLNLFLYPLFVFLPSLAVSVRRLHDLNKNGLFILIGLIPLVGGIWLFVLSCMPGTKGPNEYGADPKAV
jgi:uncharacterized membrane protein YhaH (DUF805 family)